MERNNTQIQRARRGEPTPQIEFVARGENLSVETIMEGLAGGSIVIPANINRRNLQPRGIGRGTRIKVNANIGTSEAYPQRENEKAKLAAALNAGADAVMDLSTGGDLKGIRSMVLDLCPVPVGTVPIYEAASRARSLHGGVLKMKEEDLFHVIEEHAAEGVDFLTVHCGLT
ncbi:MAG TPA: phosphomethylpyrimidine synthase, partial [Firmicutes bacterium]|nr:phosphomethylpyrimidine synthase [Bacillota bacterium]